MSVVGCTFDAAVEKLEAGIERASDGVDRLQDELRDECRLRQRAQADVLNLLSLLSGLPLGALVDAGLSTADLALIDRIEERWTKEPAQ